MSEYNADEPSPAEKSTSGVISVLIMDTTAENILKGELLNAIRELRKSDVPPNPVKSVRVCFIEVVGSGERYSVMMNRE